MQPPPLKLLGANREAFIDQSKEMILAGPSETGKTVAMCAKLHAYCAAAGANCAIVRKTKASMAGTVLRTFARVTANSKAYSALGGTIPSRYIYGNGSNIWVLGLDKPEKLLSAEYDVIYVNQAEELRESDWETLATRCTGRAGIVEHPQIFGDCNPSGSRHWIKLRAAAGRLTLLASTHKCNPSLYTDDGEMRPDGKARLERLSSALTGVRRKRLLDGVWATAEGAVFDTFDAAVHVMVRDRGEMRRYYLCQDEGYTNPSVILDIGEDADGRWHCFREFYRRGVLQSEIVLTAKQWQDEWHSEVDAVDASAAGLIADLIAAGVLARGGKGRVLDGIQTMQDRLKVQGDGRPRYTIDPSCINHINEMESYRWQPDKPKETPVKEDDHSIDSVRYLCDVLTEPTGAFTDAKGVYTGGADREDLERTRLGSDDL